MASTSVETLRAIYEKWALGDLRPGAELFADDILFVPTVDGGAGLLGKAAASEYLRGFLDHWDDFRVVAEEFEELGDTIVVTERQSGTGSASGLELEQTTYSIWRFESGRAVELRWVMDREEAMAVAGAGRAGRLR